MCGVAGRFHPIALPDAPGWAELASELLAHRGPDGEGQFRDDRCELVHRRLALIDLSPAGNQPMPNEDGSIQLVFNGEIYNYRELRERLARNGHVFRGRSDTEVLVHLYEDCGTEFVELLRGIFAFALYDKRRHRLVLARDTFGVKPLFLAAVDGQWVFASEMKAILALPGYQPALDRQACYDFVGLGYVPEPGTGFAGIEAVSPGTVIALSPEGRGDRRYRSLAAEPNPHISLQRSVDVLAEFLPEIVARQSVADVSVGALLSGGIDSSLVVAAHRLAHDTPTVTFNVRFPDPRFDETTEATTVAEHCGTYHHTLDPDERCISVDGVLDLLRHFDQPFADTSCLPMYRVSAAIRERGIVCALSGDGGDEAFGGYQQFWRLNRLVQLMQVPGWLRDVAIRTGDGIQAFTRNWGRQLAKAARLAEAGRTDATVLLAGFANYLNERDKAELVRAEARDGLKPSYRLFGNGTSSAAGDLEGLSKQLTQALFRTSLPSDMLRKVDMMSMRASIEVRVPMLDDDLVAFGLTLPHRLKSDGHNGKLVLRALAQRWLPPRITRHPKHGFAIPLDVMLAPSFHDFLADLLCGSDARTRHVFDDRLVREWLTAFVHARHGRNGGAISRDGLYQRVFILLALELWLRDHRLTW